MLIRITTSCSMGCSHCQGDFIPSEQHMTEETLEKALLFARQFKPVSAVITGGEPLEHPQAELFINKIAEQFGPDLTYLTTNGERLDADLAKRLNCMIQVVNDPRYYPRKVTPPEAENVLFFTEIWSPICPTGRAKTNNLKGGRLSPSCFNIRSLVRHSGQSLKDAILALTIRGKSCSPVIEWNGEIKLGEVCTCLPIGTLNDSLASLERNIRYFECHECNMHLNLSNEYRRAVWSK